MFPRRFALVRHIDYTGVSGVGVVAYGVVFADGHVALRWHSDYPATSLWNSIDDLLAVHGHGDATSVQWIDDVADRLHEALESLQSVPGRRARQLTETPDEDGTGDVPHADLPPPPPSSTSGFPRWPTQAEAARPATEEASTGGAAVDVAREDQLVPAQRRLGGRHRRRTGPDD